MLIAYKLAGMASDQLARLPEVESEEQITGEMLAKGLEAKGNDLFLERIRAAINCLKERGIGG